MPNSSTILNEIKGINVFEVPQGYFESLAETVMKRIRANEAASPTEELENLSPLLSTAGKKSPFVAPEGYFEDLSENVVTGISAIEFVNGELEYASPLLPGLRKTNVYEVPEGYFDQFAGSVLSKVKPARVVSMTFGKKLMRIAAAAAVAGVVAISGWFYFSSAGSGSLADAGLDKETRKQVEKLSDDEIAGFAESNTVSLADAAIASADEITESNVADLFADVSDEELQQYIEQHNGAAAVLNN